MTLYLGALQLVFALTWTVYVIFLPALAAQAGIDKSWVPFILLADQLVFALSDWAVGSATDRVGETVGKAGLWVALATLISCAAFLLLPLLAAQGAAMLLGLTFIWTLTSSALRAPPFALIGRHVPQSAQGGLMAASLFGLGLAGALGPYLTLALKGMDPRLPFALSSIVLGLLVLGLARAERALAERGNAQGTTTTSAPARPLHPGFLLAALMAALAFQIHFSLNAAPNFQRSGGGEQMALLMPLFWVGFNLMVLPAAVWARRTEATRLMALGAVVGAMAAAGIAAGPSLTLLAGLQIVAGAGWGLLLLSAFSAALAMGHTGAEGRVVGAMFSLFALAALTRIGLVAAQVPVQGVARPILDWAPVIAWALAALLLWRAAVSRPPAPA